MPKLMPIDGGKIDGLMKRSCRRVGTFLESPTGKAAVGTFATTAVTAVATLVLEVLQGSLRGNDTEEDE